MLTAPERLTPPTRRRRGHRSRPVISAVSPPRAATGPLDADALVAQAIAAGTADPRRAAERLLAAAGRDRKRLGRARSLLTRRLHLSNDDFEATLALRIVERALAGAPHPHGPWRWQHQLSSRRIRAARRRAARQRAHAYGRRRTGETAEG